MERGGPSVEGDRRKLLAWLGGRVLPHEAEVRGWLTRALNNPSDVEDVIQEAYCRLWSTTNPEQITNPRAYFFRVARNVVIDEMRKARVVRIETVAEIDELKAVSDDATPENVVSARAELRRVRQLIDGLSPRCRQIFEMRKIEGLSQKEIATKLGVSENIVENEASRGLKQILKAMEEGGGEDRPRHAALKTRSKRGKFADR